MKTNQPTKQKCHHTSPSSFYLIEVAHNVEKVKHNIELKHSENNKELVDCQHGLLIILHTGLLQYL